jgi:transposase
MTKVFVQDNGGTPACQTCGIIWQGDINAAKNIQEIAESEIIDKQGRPSAFERPTRTNK